MTNALSVLSRQPRAAVAAATAAAAATGVLAHKWNAAVRSRRLEKGFLRPLETSLRDQRESRDKHNDDREAEDAAKVDMRFIRKLWHFFRICIPSMNSKEFGVFITVAALLAARSWLDLWNSSNGGHVVKAIVGRDKDAFIKRAVIDIATMMFPMSFVNNSLRYMISRLKILMRRRLSMYFHDKYLSANTFYKVSNLDSRIRNVDQLLTVDIERFCTSLADLYSNLSKPAIDIYLFSRRLSKSLGPSGPLAMISYFAACSVVLRAIQPPFGQLAAAEQRLEGEYRLHHSRLITHSEEIAFFGGGAREKLYINNAFDNLVSHLRSVFAARWRNGIVDAILVKYVATIVGYVVVSLPIFFADSPLLRILSGPNNGPGGSNYTDPETTSASNIAGLYTRNSRLLLSLAGAIGRIVLAGKEITKMTGYCQRVSRLENVLNELGDKQYVKKRFQSSTDMERTLRLAELMKPGVVKIGSKEDDADEGGADNAFERVENGSESERTKKHSKNGLIKFEEVNLFSPDGTLLLENLNVEFHRGCHVLLSGANGSGKSSVLRLMSQLWPVYGGTLYLPAGMRLFYVPQRPYLALGSLRENVTYPLTWSEAVTRKRATDEMIQTILDQVHLGDVARRPGGLDAVQDWQEVLSGGQKQRVGFSRLLFHRPEYAILDEASSAVSVDIEQVLYQAVKDCGTTLISVSHRPSLWSFHDKVFKLDGKGGYEFREILESDVPNINSGLPMGCASSSQSAPTAHGFAATSEK